MAKKQQTEETRAVAAWARERGMEDWRLAGVLRLTGWTADKHVTARKFDDAAARFASRRAGGR